VDLVLARTSIQGMDGFELCRRIRANNKTAAVPVSFWPRAEPWKTACAGWTWAPRTSSCSPSSRWSCWRAWDRFCTRKRSPIEVRRHNIELAGKVVERTRQLEELAGELRAERDALRDTFNAIEDGSCSSMHQVVCRSRTTPFAA